MQRRSRHGFHPRLCETTRVFAVTHPLPCILAAGCCAVALSGAAPAATAATFYTDVSDFAIATDNSIGFLTEGFEDAASPASPLPSRTFAWGSVTETGGTNAIHVHPYDIMPGPLSYGSYTGEALPAALGSDSAIWYHNDGASMLAIAFGSAVSALSLYLSSGDNGLITVTGSTGWTTTAASTANDPSYWGVTSDTPFTSLTLRGQAPMSAWII
ncbi:hypothetical protein [Salipiger aestuarii]|uniref:hypothetical protein n=1 Tax=Salipiger aestuarii TaxID=568098 RepID=UPI00123B5556|nr:hypothetical protein [Salipiger aestuarii]